MKDKQEQLLQDLWTVYYGNPLYDEDGHPTFEGYEKVLARALIAVLTGLELPDSSEVPN